MPCKRCARGDDDSLKFCSFCGGERVSGRKQAFLMRAEKWKEEGDFQAAISDLTKAKAVEAENQFIDLLLGNCHENVWMRSRRNEDLEAARRHYSDFLKIDFNSENVHQLFIGTYQKEGRLDEVRKRYRGYLEADAGNEMLARCLRWIDIATNVGMVSSGDRGRELVGEPRLMRTLMWMSMAIGMIELTVAGALVKSETGSRGDILLHGLIGVICLGIAIYLFVVRYRDQRS